MDLISRRSSLRKFAKKVAKKSHSESTMAVTRIERKPKQKVSPRKVEIQSLSELYLICDFYSKFSKLNNHKACRDDDCNESNISVLQREFSESTHDLGWPFNTRATKSGLDRVVRLAMSLPTRSVSFNVVISPKSRPGWPLLLIPVPPKNSGESQNEKTESPASQSELDLLLEASHCERFKYEQLSVATSHFASENIIGEGGCSSVYKGDIESDNKTVAVKVLKPYKEAWNDFSLQVKIASSIKHQNIVPLLGICLENGLLISVHDFFPKGSLEDYLHGDKNGSVVLPWKARFNVAVAIAEALKYLHDDCIIIHRDVKSSNILLTTELEPKLSDFGLAICGSTESAYSLDGDVAGTFGYIAPEYLMYGQISEKIDVYAFGVVLLELLTGRRPICAEVPKGHESLVKWARDLLEGGDYEALVDPKLKGDFDVVQMQRMVLAARLCISKSPRVRPKVSQILKLLKEYNDDNDASDPFDSSFSESNEDNDDDEHSLFHFEIIDILDADNESMSPSSDTAKETRRLKFKDFLDQQQW